MNTIEKAQEQLLKGALLKQEIEFHVKKYPFTALPVIFLGLHLAIDSIEFWKNECRRLRGWKVD